MSFIREMIDKVQHRIKSESSLNAKKKETMENYVAGQIKMVNMLVISKQTAIKNIKSLCPEYLPYALKHMR